MEFIDQNVKQYLKRFVTIDVDIAVTRGMEHFIHATGSINLNSEDKGKGLLDSVFINVENQGLVSGIKTYIRKHYYFDFMWNIPKDSVVIIDEKLGEKPGVIDTFESVFNSLHGYLLCSEITIDKIPYKVIFDYASMVFAIDLSKKAPQIFHKFTILHKRKHQLDTNECWKDINEVRFNVTGIPLTVKQFLLAHYLLEYIKLIKIYHLDLKRV